MKKKNIFEGYFNAAGFQPPILWTIPFDNSRISYNFPTELFARYQLVSGVRVCCEIKNDQVVDVISICGKTPEEYLERSDFNKLVPVMPSDKFDFGTSDSLAVRTIDLIAPIGKGTRGLIVSPPRAGKTMLLEAIANDIYRIDPKLHVIILLIDERPEEVTSFQQNTKAPVFFSSLDMGAASHIALSSFLVNHVRTELECGNDIVILIDSLTRMGRAYNIDGNYYNDRIMSGGLASGALNLPRKLFGMARNIQDGGSCTILATILVDTGSRMDEVIFQEFKGTGNCEIVLDRDLAEERIFPALNITESGTRREELLRPVAEVEKINSIRRTIIPLEKNKAVSQLIQMIENSPSNLELLASR